MLATVALTCPVLTAFIVQHLFGLQCFSVECFVCVCVFPLFHGSKAHSPVRKDSRAVVQWTREEIHSMVTALRAS